jgi:hypothetical protein
MSPEELPPHSIVLDKLEAAEDSLSEKLGSGGWPIQATLDFGLDSPHSSKRRA